MATDDEIESLNLDDLDVEELERRLELAPAGAALGPAACGDGCIQYVGPICPPDCPSNCPGNCYRLCALKA
jgi:hypothetical protein